MILINIATWKLQFAAQLPPLNFENISQFLNPGIYGSASQVGSMEASNSKHFTIFILALGVSIFDR